MNKDLGQHPSESDLLLFLDGELGNGKVDNIRKHLDACWTCRMHAASLQEAIVEFARERERIGPAEPPSPWRDLTGDFRQIHETKRLSLARNRVGELFRKGRVALFFAVIAAFAGVMFWSLPKQTNAIERKDVPNVLEASPSQKPVASKAEPPRNSAFDRRFNPATITHEEIAVLSRLHELKADLGEPIELQRSTDRLVLTASGLKTERSQAIRVALAGIPDLTIRFTVPEVQVQEGGLPASPSTERQPVAFQTDLLAFTGGRQQLQNLGDALLDASDQVTTYVHALDNLETRFPAALVSSMSEDDRGVLRRIQSDHRIAARYAAHSLDRLIEPIFDTLGINRGIDTRETLIEASLNVDRLLNAAFAGAQSDLSDHELYVKLRKSLARVLELLD
ncbi:MAG TPA: hypothetical protein VKU01_09190 [Bryobacteraceae bacterium]|nr:hypothetical protein [Bryobacteraceae bacterium]